jgi:CheY-like chemotaxis protein
MAVRICIESIINDPDYYRQTDDLRVDLFRHFHLALDRSGIEVPPAEDEGGEVPTIASLREGVASLSSRDRQVLLLVALESFSLDQVARILDLHREEAEQCLARARLQLQDEAVAKVFIIEDESIIASDIAAVVAELGHQVVGCEASQAGAIEAAKRVRPDLILADIQLRGGGNGIVAVQEILKFDEVPVIFVTGFPERLLTGKGVEPAFVITKPFEASALAVAISQALASVKASAV